MDEPQLPPDKQLRRELEDLHRFAMAWRLQHRDPDVIDKRCETLESKWANKFTRERDAALAANPGDHAQAETYGEIQTGLKQAVNQIRAEQEPDTTFTIAMRRLENGSDDLSPEAVRAFAERKQRHNERDM